MTAITFDTQVATKVDLREMEFRLNASLRDLDLRITIRLGGMIIAGCVFLAGIKYFG